MQSLATPDATLVLLKLTGVLVVCDREGGSLDSCQSRPGSRDCRVVVWCKKDLGGREEASLYGQQSRGRQTAPRPQGERHATYANRGSPRHWTQRLGEGSSWQEIGHERVCCPMEYAEMLLEYARYLPLMR